MTTATAARDAVAGVINTAWLASGVTSAIALQWDNVAADPIGKDTNGLPLPYGRVTLRTLVSDQETIGGQGLGKMLTEAALTVDIFTPFGDGHILGDQIVEVLKTALRGVNVGNLWFFQVGANELGQEGPYFRQQVRGGVRYEERI